MGFLPISEGHTMYYEEHGNPKGKPALILHGGPGGSLNRKELRFFDLRKWFVILYDQRGCGKSTPYGVDSLKHNTTAHLIRDMEVLRKHLDIDTWYIVGSSWGTTLGLVYAETYPKNVSGMFLRSLCLSENDETKWMYQYDGAASIFPEAWARFASVLKPLDRKKSWRVVTQKYRNKLTNSNKSRRFLPAKRWGEWEHDIVQLIPTKQKANDDEALAILENHYFLHHSFLTPNQILKNADTLKNIPIIVVQGRYDLICPFRSAWKLKQTLPHIHLFEVPDGGHGGRSAKVIQRMKELIANAL